MALTFSRSAQSLLLGALAWCGGSPAHAATLAQYAMGENDPGAADAAPANPTTTATAGGDLLRIGDPTYSSNAAPGGSTLSIRFDGDKDYFYGAAPTTELTRDFSFAFDASLATPAASFAFVASLGGNFGGISLLEGGPHGAGNVGLFLPGVGLGGATSVFTPTVGQWHRYEVDWNASAQQFSLTVDGNLITQTNPGQLPAGGALVDAFTLGGNYRVNAPALSANRTDADFEGSFNGWIDNVVFEGTPPSVPPRLEIDRDTGGLTLINQSGENLQFLGYRIRSEFQALDTALWTSIADNYDAGNPGPQQISTDNWTELSPNPNFSLSEFESDGGSGATLVNGASLELGAGDGAATVGPWQPSYVQDVVMELLLPDGTLAGVNVVYTGNGGVPFARSDFNRDGAINAADWLIYRTGLDGDLADATLLGAYLRGDLDGDLDNDIDDFGLFKADFIAANSPAAFAALFAAVPEPSTTLLLCASVLCWRRTRSRTCNSELNMPRSYACSSLARGIAAALLTATLLCGVQTAQAGFTTVGEYRLGEDDPGAAAGGAAKNPTVALVGQDLALIGGATYSNDVPAGGSTLSMRLVGDGGAPGAAPDTFFYSNAPTTDVTQNITYSFDAKLGTPSSSFGFIASLGGNFGGISVLEVNGNVQIFFPGVGGGTGSLNINDGQWHRFQVDYQFNGGEGNQFTTLSIDGNVVSTREGPTANNTIVDAFTLGANWRGPGGIDDIPNVGFEAIDRFEGGWNGWIDNVLVQTFIQPLLTLEVNTTTGATRLLNVTGEPIAFDFYTIGSDAGALAPGGSPADANGDGRVDGADLLILQRTNLGLIPLWEEEFGTAGGGGAGWNSLQDQNLAGFPAGNGSGNGWEQSGGSDANVLTEAYLTGSSVLEDGALVSLGAAYDPSVLGAGAEGDLTFRFRSPSGAVYDGNIVYVSGAATSAVPEPSTALVAIGLFAAATARRRRAGQVAFTAVQPEQRKLALVALATVLGVAASWSTASAAYTVDRLYRLGDGDNDAGTPTAGAPVGSTTSTGDTFDDAGTSGNFTLIDLAPFGGPTYANVASRPLASGSTLGVSFDGVNDYLTGFRLGLPETSVSSTLSTQVNPLNLNDTIVGALDYSGISNRGFQLWANPFDAILGNGAVQTVIRDTNQHGVSISGAGTWLMEYGGQNFDTGVAVKRDNASDGSSGWHHVMLVRPSGTVGGARLYVDGLGIGAIAGGYDGGDANYLTLGAATGNLANDDPNDNPGQGNFFRGVIDDLEMFVVGQNASTNFGAFNFATDNKFAAAQLAGKNAADVNGDGFVNQSDVAVLAANFDTVNRVNGVALPDLAYRNRGDLDLNGVIDLLDAFVLHQGLLAAGQAGINFAALTGVVPEPTAIALAWATLGVALAQRRRVGC